MTVRVLETVRPATDHRRTRGHAAGKLRACWINAGVENVDAYTLPRKRRRISKIARGTALVDAIQSPQGGKRSTLRRRHMLDRNSLDGRHVGIFLERLQGTRWQ